MQTGWPWLRRFQQLGRKPKATHRSLDHAVNGVGAPSAAVVEARIEEDAVGLVRAEEVRVDLAGAKPQNNSNADGVRCTVQQLFQ